MVSKNQHVPVAEGLEETSHLIPSEPSKKNASFSFLNMGAKMRLAMPRTAPLARARIILAPSNAQRKMLPFARENFSIDSTSRSITRKSKLVVKLQEGRLGFFLCCPDSNVRWSARSCRFRFHSRIGVAVTFTVTKDSRGERKTERFALIAANGSYKFIGAAELLRLSSAGSITRDTPLSIRGRLIEQRHIALSKHGHSLYPRFGTLQLLRLVGDGTNRVITLTSHQAVQKPLSNPNYPQDEQYLSLTKAAKKANCSENKLLEAASDKKIKLCIPIPDGVSLYPFDKYSETKGIAKILPPPEKLILEDWHCKQIIENHKTVQSDFPRGYILSFGKPILRLTGYADPAFARAVWRAFSGNECCSIEITQDDIQITHADLQTFIRENPQSNSTTPPAFVEGMRKFLTTIVDRAAKDGLVVEIHQLPCSREQLRIAAGKFDPILDCDSERTFNTYLNGICGFRAGRVSKKAPNLLIKIFPEYYSSISTHRT